LAALGTPAGGCGTASATQACLIDPVLTTANVNGKGGYKINTSSAGGGGTIASPNTTFGVDAWPVTYGSTGTRSFCADESGSSIIRPSVVRSANPIQRVKRSHRFFSSSVDRGGDLSPLLFSGSTGVLEAPMFTRIKFAQQQLRARVSRGFSLIEPLVLVAIIRIIVAIAIPQLLRARIAANEAAAAETVRSVTTASMAYSSTWGNGFPASLATLDGPTGAFSDLRFADLMDPIVTTAPNQKSGFKYAYTALGTPVSAPVGFSAAGRGSNAYLVTATPIAGGVSGIRIL
jgi:type II secretory pathway pseudopilin PulG